MHGSLPVSFPALFIAVSSDILFFIFRINLTAISKISTFSSLHPFLAYRKVEKTQELSSK